MKNLSFVLAFLITGSLLSSCIKDSLPPAQKGTTNTQTSAKKDTVTTTVDQPIDQSLLVGNWQLINDTSTTVPWGLWQGQPTSGHNYMGQPSDYYKFTADDHAYTSISGFVDTANYTISRDTVHVVYTYFNGIVSTDGVYNSFWRVTNLTAHTATITTIFITPETVITSVTNLKK
jgi:hypothetical protein